MRGPTVGRPVLLLLLALIYMLSSLHPGVSAQGKVNTTIMGARGTTAVFNMGGGAISIFRDFTKPGSNSTLKTGEINVSFGPLRELNSNLTQVVDSKLNQTHTLKTMSNQTFTCKGVENRTMPYSTNVTADCISCSTDFKEIFTPLVTVFKIQACVIKENGSITQLDEVSNVTVGQLKFTVELQGWNWCDGNCVGGAGEFLDLDVSIRVPAGKGAKIQSTRDKLRPKTFDLGEIGAKVEFSTVALLDGTFKNLASDTPTLIQTEGLSVVTLRFPRFVYSMLYDPTVDTGDKIYSDPRGSAAFKASASLPLLTACIAALLVMTSRP